jgi:hypothetical protein
MLRAIPLLLAAGTGLVARADDDRRYRPEGGGYSIVFPAGLDVTSRVQDAPNGVKLSLVSADAPGKAFAVMELVLPDAAKGVPAKTLLDAGQNGAIRKSAGKLIESKDVAFGGDKLPGRELLVEKDGNRLLGKVIVAGTRVYMVLAGGKDDYVASEEAAAFLASFELAK